MGKPLDAQSTSVEDVRQLGLFAAIASLSYVFWVVGAMAPCLAVIAMIALTIPSGLKVFASEPPTTTVAE